MFVMLCAIIALLSLCLLSFFFSFFFFFGVLAYWFGLDLDPIVFVIIRTP